MKLDNIKDEAADKSNVTDKNGNYVGDFGYEQVADDIVNDSKVIDNILAQGF